MAINKVNGVSAVTVEELLKQDLRIPNYQRPYSWEVLTALQLVDDVAEALRDPLRHDVPYVLGAVILHQEGGYLHIVDGQQRLLTLRMILALLDTAQYGMVLPTEGQTTVSLVWKRCNSALPQWIRPANSSDSFEQWMKDGAYF